MTGPLITSSQLEMENLTMTSTTCNLCAEPVMEGSKTGCCNVSPGAILAISRGRVKTEGGGYWSSYRPGLLRKRKAKHKASWIRYGWRSQLLWLRLSWRSHWKPSLDSKLANLLSKNKKKR